MFPLSVWECEPWEKHLIIKRITEYILTKHFLPSKEDVVHTVDQLDFCLHVGGKGERLRLLASCVFNF